MRVKSFFLTIATKRTPQTFTSSRFQAIKDFWIYLKGHNPVFAVMTSASEKEKLLFNFGGEQKTKKRGFRLRLWPLFLNHANFHLLITIKATRIFLKSIQLLLYYLVSFESTFCLACKIDGSGHFIAINFACVNRGACFRISGKLEFDIVTFNGSRYIGLP